MKHEFSLAEAQLRYSQLQRQLAKTDWISEGYVQDRGPGAGGPCYQWTRKVRKKTISVALSKQQYQWLKTAIENWRTLQDTLRLSARFSNIRLLVVRRPGNRFSLRSAETTG
jgi:hypothetical protein